MKRFFLLLIISSICFSSCEKYDIIQPFEDSKWDTSKYPICYVTGNNEYYYCEFSGNTFFLELQNNVYITNLDVLELPDNYIYGGTGGEYAGASISYSGKWFYQNEQLILREVTSKLSTNLTGWLTDELRPIDKRQIIFMAKLKNPSDKILMIRDSLTNMYSNIQVPENLVIDIKQHTKDKLKIVCPVFGKMSFTPPSAYYYKE